MTGLPMRIQVPCLGGFHDVVLSRRGSLSFPAHKDGIKELERMLNFEELGGKIEGGCHKLWLSWINATNSLPAKLAEYRKNLSNCLTAERILRTWQGPARSREWGPFQLTEEAISKLPKDREQYRRGVLLLISQELAARGHRGTWKRNASDPPDLGSIFEVKCFDIFVAGDFIIEAGWYPAGSVALTITIGRIEQVNVVRGKNEQAALIRCVDLAERRIVQEYLINYWRRTAPNEDAIREQLLRKAARLNDELGQHFFQACPATSLDSLAIRGNVPGPMSDAAARLALQWLDRVSQRIEKLRALSQARMKTKKTHSDKSS